jgi:hypothetical protein
MKKLLLIIFICTVVTSCTSVSQRLSSNPPPEKYQMIGASDCTGCGFLLFDFIPIAWRGMTKRAYNCAIESKGGDDLISPTIQESWYWIPLIGSIRCTNVAGIVIKKQP